MDRFEIQQLSRREEIGGDQQQNAFQQLFGAGIPHKFNKVVDDEGDQSNIHRVQDQPVRGDKSQDVAPQIG